MRKLIVRTLQLSCEILDRLPGQWGCRIGLAARSWDLERLMGWSSRGGMVKHYARSAADARAKDAHRRMGLGDRY